MANLAPSKNPITIRMNEWLFEKYLTHFMDRYLPNYIWRKTSGTRDAQTNRDVGGVEDSAHLYGLAQDGNLINRNTGEIVDEATGRKIFNEYFEPYWEGYAEFSPGRPDKRWHVHLHIDREINHVTKWAGIGVAAVAGALIIKKFIQPKKA